MVHVSISNTAASLMIAALAAGVASPPVFGQEKAESSAPAGQAVNNAAESVTLADALALAVQKNPGLAVFSWDIRAAEAREIQARLFPNPELSLEIEDVRLGKGPGARNTSRTLGYSNTSATSQASTEDGSGSFSESLGYESTREFEEGAPSGFSESQFTLTLSQLVELGGKRAKRMQLAARDRELEAWEYEVARADVLKDTAQAFVAVVAAQERIALDDELVRLAEQVFQTVSARVDAGRVSPLEATKAQTALSMAQLQANASRRSLEAARAALAALWGDTEARFERAAGGLEDIRPVPSLEDIRKRIDKNPELSRWQAEIEKRQSAIDVEKAKAVPDVTVSAGFRTRGVADRETWGYGFGSDGVSLSEGTSDSNGDWENSIVLGVSVPLPLFNRNQGSIQEAQHLASQAGDQRRAVDVEANARLTKAYENLSTAFDTISSLKGNVLPAATNTFNSINEAYKQGKFGYLDVLDAQQTMFEARRKYLDALAAYHENVAEIERTLGESLWNTGQAEPAPDEEK